MKVIKVDFRKKKESREDKINRLRNAYASGTLEMNWSEESLDKLLKDVLTSKEEEKPRGR